jgi:hypothetical protein
LCEAVNRAASEKNLWNAVRQSRLTLYYSHLRVRATELPSLLRDIVGNPFRPLTAKAAWLSDTVVAVARGAYEVRDFERLPIVADALEEAGCTEPVLLGHLRTGGPHVRGCWAVDLLLSKE